MDVSILICTWNRAEKLRKCLSSLQNLEVPIGLQWEILIINNCCTDHTSSVIQSFYKLLPIREVVEDQLGHSVSRNKGISNSCGKLILFTDDDVQVDPKWMSEIKRVSDQYPKSSIFGGPIYPYLEKVPHQIRKCMESPFFDGLILRKNLGTEVRPLDHSESLFGANMAFRRNIFSLLNFDSRLGLRGNVPLRGDETDLINRARTNGETVVWVPQAKVTHPIDSDRVGWGASGRYFWGLGRTHFRLKRTLLYPQLQCFSFFGFWSQFNFFIGCWYEKLLSYFSSLWLIQRF